VRKPDPLDRVAEPEDGQAATSNVAPTPTGPDRSTVA
jgi:hypothetical protein